MHLRQLVASFGTLALLLPCPGARPQDPAEVATEARPGFTGGLLVQLQVKELERSIRFYRDVLGFELTERRDDLAFAHIATGLDGLQLGLSVGETAPQPGTVVLNFDVRGDLEALRGELEKKGVTFLGPTQVIPGKVRLATFKDPDGYSVRLAGEDV